MELAPVYDLNAVNQRHFRHFQFLVQRDSGLISLPSLGNDLRNGKTTSPGGGQSSSFLLKWSSQALLSRGWRCETSEPPGKVSLRR
jgi:hypothetical protein